MSTSEDPFPDLPVDPDVTLEADVPPPRIHTTALAAIAMGGALGALARWVVAEAPGFAEYEAKTDRVIPVIRLTRTPAG